MPKPQVSEVVILEQTAYNNWKRLCAEIGAKYPAYQDKDGAAWHIRGRARIGGYDPITDENYELAAEYVANWAETHKPVPVTPSPAASDIAAELDGTPAPMPPQAPVRDEKPAHGQTDRPAPKHAPVVAPVAPKADYAPEPTPESCRLTPAHLAKLRAPFAPDKISFKVQTKPNEKGTSLVVAYIDARDVMDRLDEVAGGDWSDNYRSAPSGGLECSLTVLGITRRDVGDDEKDNEAEKAGYSDAFKRAAVKFGVGRFLYDLPKMWAQTKAYGKNVYLADGEEDKLRKQVAAALKR